jgi:hypothetical protein
MPHYCAAVLVLTEAPRKGEEGPEALFSARGPREPGDADWDTSDDEIMKMTGPNGTHSQKYLKSISKVSLEYLNSAFVRDYEDDRRQRQTFSKALY